MLRWSRWAILCLSTAVLVAVHGCASTRVSLVQSADFTPEPDEKALWDDAAKFEFEMEKTGAYYHDEQLQRYLDSVAERLRPTMGAGQARLRIRVVKAPFLNAFATPNGTLYFFTGVLALMENEAQFATVLGHEVTHYIGRHRLKEIRSHENRMTVAKTFAIILAGISGDLRAIQLVGDVSRPVLRAQYSGYSRDLEREADARSLEAMAAAGYDPSEAPKTFIQLQREEDEAGIKEPYVYASHPRLAERIESYTAALEKQNRPTAVPPVIAADPYNDAISQLLLDNAGMDMDLRRMGRARRAIERHLAHRPESAGGYFALGELHRRSGEAETERAAAVAAYQQSLRLDPSTAVAHRELGMLYRTQGNLVEGRAELRRYLELAADAPDRPIIQGYLDEMEEPARKARAL